MEFEKTELVITEKQLNLFALIAFVGIFLLFYLPFGLFWGFAQTFLGFKLMIKHLLIWLIPMIIIHEGLHGLFWALALKGNFKQIKFGFNKRMLAPYTHCKVSLTKKSYLMGGLAPLFFLGIIPVIGSFVTGNAYIFSLALVCIWTSCGDILSCFHLIKTHNTFKVQDHPDKLGFILVKD